MVRCRTTYSTCYTSTRDARDRGGALGSEEANRRLVRLRCFSGIQHHHYHSGSSDGGGWPYVWERRNERKDLALPQEESGTGSWMMQGTPPPQNCSNCPTAQLPNRDTTNIQRSLWRPAWSVGHLVSFFVRVLDGDIYPSTGTKTLRRARYGPYHSLVALDR